MRISNCNDALWWAYIIKILILFVIHEIWCASRCLKPLKIIFAIVKKQISYYLYAVVKKNNFEFIF